MICQIRKARVADCWVVGGVILLDLVCLLVLLSIYSLLTQPFSEKKQQITLRAYEHVLPPGAPGGAGYRNPVGSYDSPEAEVYSHIS